MQRKYYHMVMNRKILKVKELRHQSFQKETSYILEVTTSYNLRENLNLITREPDML